jgi:hypothetical protein
MLVFHRTLLSNARHSRSGHAGEYTRARGRLWALNVGSDDGITATNEPSVHPSISTVSFEADG